MPNKSVADIFADFELQRRQSVFVNEGKIRSNPKIARIERQRRAFLAEKLALKLRGADTREIERKISACEAQKRQAVEEEGLALPPRCEICGDSGVVGRRYCTCFLSILYRELYGALDITRLKASFDRFDLSLLDDQTAVKHGRTQRQIAGLAKKICEDYIDEFPDTHKLNILLTGKTGLGKSYMLHCMAKKAAHKGIDTMLIRAGELFSAFHAHRLGGAVPLSYLHNAALLLIDDLGTEPVTQNVSAEYLFELVNKRLESKKHTVVATNADDLEKRYDERISSRIESKRDTILLVLDGKDLGLR